MFLMSTDGAVLSVAGSIGLNLSQKFSGIFWSWRRYTRPEPGLVGVLFPVVTEGVKVGGIILAGDTRAGWELACLAGGREGNKARDSDLFPLPPELWGAWVWRGDRSPERERGSLPGSGWEGLANRWELVWAVANIWELAWELAKIWELAWELANSWEVASIWEFANWEFANSWEFAVWMMEELMWGSAPVLIRESGKLVREEGPRGELGDLFFCIWRQQEWEWDESLGDNEGRKQWIITQIKGDRACLLAKYTAWEGDLALAATDK